MKKTGNMIDTREEITDFNNQLSISIWVKRRIQERYAVVSTSSTSQATGEETVTGDGEIIEAATPSTSQAIEEETMGSDDAQPPIEYDKGYEFNRFFQGADWFYGVVTAFQEEEDVRQVRFDGGKDPSDTITVEELDRICEDPELGGIGFQFVRQFHGNAAIDGKIESISSKNKFVCCFDDGDIHTYSRKAMTKMAATNLS